MGEVFERIDATLADWIEAQPLFFVSTAPPAAESLVDISPTGTVGTFRVLGEHGFTYLDLTGSGVETVSHLRENGRTCVMFCAFDGGPKIIRLHGTGRVTVADDPGFAAAIEPFGAAALERLPRARAVITVDVARVASACGCAVPRMQLVAERTILDDWSATRGQQRLAAHHAQRNATSIDGLPGLPLPAGNR